MVKPHSVMCIYPILVIRDSSLRMHHKATTYIITSQKYQKG